VILPNAAPRQGDCLTTATALGNRAADPANHHDSGRARGYVTTRATRLTPERNRRVTASVGFVNLTAVDYLFRSNVVFLVRQLSEMQQ
jgi:hypothetical protein